MDAKDKRLESAKITRDALIVAYYLSREDKIGVEKLGYRNYQDAFKGVGNILNQKASTIKNMRDEFDPYCDNGRKGWYERPLSPSRKAVIEQYSKLAESELRAVVNYILSSYSNTTKEDQAPAGEEKKNKSTQRASSQGHTKIVLGSGKMKEIHTKR